MGIMDTWKRGRIIYAYLIWVVFKATTAGGLYGEYTYIRYHFQDFVVHIVVVEHRPENSYVL